MVATSSKQKHPELTPLTLWIMTIATGLIVANLYYNQPLLDEMAHTFHASAAKVGQVSWTTQIGYAAGMFFLAPLADMVKRKRLMMMIFGFIVLSLLITAASASVNLLVIFSFILGAASLI